jgi:hypothetical protein
VNERVRVYVNDQEAMFHLGLKVKHAIGARWARKVREQRAVVRDAAGNRYDLDGALYDGQKLYVEDTTPEKFWGDLKM